MNCGVITVGHGGRLAAGENLVVSPPDAAASLPGAVGTVLSCDGARRCATVRRCGVCDVCDGAVCVTSATVRCA
jgi:hypothetical protein